MQKKKQESLTVPVFYFRVLYMSKEIIMKTCPNCGAEIENDLSKCPYCGYINIEGAEKEYMEELGEIRVSLAEVDDEAAKTFKRGMSKGIRTLLITILAILLVAALLTAWLAFETKDGPKLFPTAEDKAFASAYKLVAEEELEAAYEAGDIAKMAQIYHTARTEARVSLFGINHYESSYASYCYISLQESLPNLDKKRLSKFEAEKITYYCFYFYYRAYGEDGAEIFDEVRDNEIMPIIQNRLGYSIEDMEGFRSELTDGGSVVRPKLYKTTKRYYKNYH